MLYSVSGPSHLYPQLPSLVHVDSILFPLVQGGGRPMCAQSYCWEPWRPRLPSHPHAFLQLLFPGYSNLLLDSPLPIVTVAFGSTGELATTTVDSSFGAQYTLPNLVLANISFLPYFFSAWSSKLIPIWSCSIDGFSQIIGFTGTVQYLILVKMGSLCLFFFCYRIAPWGLRRLKKDLLLLSFCFL